MRHAELRFYADLAELAGSAEVSVPIGGARAVKDVVEACGVPHPEVGLLLVDSVPVGFGHHVVGGERVAVYPPWRRIDLTEVRTVEPPPIEPRFVLDVHLGALTRRLRLLGFDCRYRPDADDVWLAGVAASEERILLTRDRGLLMRRTVVHGYCPRSDDPDRQALEVVRRYDLSERQRPLTRCVACNGSLEGVSREEVLDLLPPRTRRAFVRFARCSVCGKVYWPGSHVEAMAGFLTDAAGATRPNDGERAGAGSPVWGDQP